MQFLPPPKVPESPVSEGFAPLLRLARSHFGASAALISEGASTHQSVLIRDGLAFAELTQLELSAWPSAPLIITDTRLEQARQQLPTLPDELRALIVCPLHTPGAVPAGLLCLLHEHPLQAGSIALDALSEFARLAQACLNATLELKALRHSEKRMALAISGSNTGIWDRDLRTEQIHYSTRWKAMLGYAEDEIGSSIQESYTRVHPDDLARVQATIRDHLEQRTEAYEVEHRIRRRDNRYTWVCSRGKVVERDDSGRPLRMVGTTTDISALRGMAEQLQHNAELMSALSNQIPGMVFQYHAQADGSGRFTYVSAGARDIYGLAPRELERAPHALQHLIHPDDLPLYLDSLAAAARTLAPWHLEYRVCLGQADPAWRQGAARPTRQEDGSVLWHGFISDITERKKAERELNTLATTDGLTQLANRRHFMQQLEAELARLRRSVSHCATLLMLDLDHFKRINDDWGHAMGDRALRHFAAIICSHLRKTDAAGRVGGEEFAVVLSDADLDAAIGFARRIQLELADSPLLHGAHPIYLATSIGIATIGVADENAEAALSRSDMALYRAKRAGRNRIECHETH